MEKYLLLVLIVILSSCTSNESTPTDETGLIGKWKLIEQLADPGDGSGKFQPISSKRVIEFFNDGTVSVNGDLCFMTSEVGKTVTGTYMKTSDNNSDTQYEGEIIPNSCSSRSAKVYFDLSTSGDLLLWYQCIEGCGQKFIKFF